MTGQSTFFVAPGFQPVMRQIGLDADACFTHPDIRVWRSLPERENCTLDAVLSDGHSIRLHLKRYPPSRSAEAQNEINGLRLLQQAGIPTVPLVAWGTLADGRAVIITEDLAGYTPADKLLAAGADFDTLLPPIADLAAKLHSANLHHRDLYLCHFFVRRGDACVAQGEAGLAPTGPPRATQASPVHIRLIDPARVRLLPRWPFRNRWIVKDLAQLWYSTLALPVTDAQRTAMLHRYAAQRNIHKITGLQNQIERKARAIARHDQRLRRKQPARNISIPAK